MTNYTEAYARKRFSEDEDYNLDSAKWRDLVLNKGRFPYQIETPIENTLRDIQFDALMKAVSGFSASALQYHFCPVPYLSAIAGQYCGIVALMNTFSESDYEKKDAELQISAVEDALPERFRHDDAHIKDLHAEFGGRNSFLKSYQPFADYIEAEKLMEEALSQPDPSWKIVKAEKDVIHALEDDTRLRRDLFDTTVWVFHRLCELKYYPHFKINDVPEYRIDDALNYLYGQKKGK